MAKIYTDGSWQNIQLRKYGTDTDNITSFPQNILTSGDNVNSYSVYGNMVQDSYNEHTFSGTSPLSYDSNGSNLVRYGIDGNMTQTGTPTPSAPVQPEECGDRTANIAFKKLADTNINQYGTIITNGAFDLYVARIEQGSVYSSNSTLFAYYTDEPVLGSTAYDGERHIESFVGVSAPITGYVCLRVDKDRQLMINAGRTVLDYEPYGYALPISCGDTTQTIYLSEPLRKIGDYADTISSDGTVTRRIKKLVLTGEETFGRNSGYSVCYTTIGNGITGYGGIVTTLCTHYLAQINVNAYANMADLTVATKSNGSQIWIRDTTRLSVTDFKQFLSDQYAAGTPVTVWYVLATPETETITAPQISTIKGSNTLSVTTTLAPSNIEVVSNIDLSPDNIIWPEECGEKTVNLAYSRIEDANVGSDGIIHVFPDDYDLAIARVENGVTYTANSYVLAFFTNEPVIGSVSYNNSRTIGTVGEPTTFTAPIDGYVVFRITHGEPAMLNTGLTALPYEPYGKYKIPITVGNNTQNIIIDSPIRKIGDYIDVIGNNGTVSRRIMKLVLDGTEEWGSIYKEDNTNYFRLQIGAFGTVVAGQCICTHFEQKTISTSNEDVGVNVFNSSGIIASVVAIRPENSGGMLISTFKSYLNSQYTAGTPVTVWYVLSTPDTSEQTTIPVIQTIEGSNTINVDTTLKPSNLEISYKGWHKINEKIYTNGSWT